jgi:hypothetical protein
MLALFHVTPTPTSTTPEPFCDMLACTTDPLVWAAVIGFSLAPLIVVSPILWYRWRQAVKRRQVGGV